MKLAYIAGKYTGATKEEVQQNIDIAEDIGKQMLLKGYAPIIPHKITSHWERDSMFEMLQHSDWMRVCLAWLDKCDVIVMCPGWKESKGATQEYHHACGRKIPIVFYGQTV
ncbi:MAG: DUF1937 family protein [Geobacter sp.]|jgi:hypothetical protein